MELEGAQLGGVCAIGHLMHLDVALCLVGLNVFAFLGLSAWRYGVRLLAEIYDGLAL